MYNEEDDYQEISLVQCFGLVFKNFWKIVVVALICAAVGLVLSFFKSTEAFEEEYANWKMKQEVLENSIEVATDSLQRQQEYIKESQRMKLNPISVAKTTSYYKVGEDSEQFIATSDGRTLMKPEYFAQYYVKLLNTLDFSEVVGTDVPLRLIKELISISSVADEIVLSITGANSTVTENWSASIGKEIAKYASFKESRTLVDKDDDLANWQKAQTTRADETATAIVEYKEELKTLEKEEPHQSGLLKYTILGCFVGGLIAACYYALVPVLKGQFSSSSDVEDFFKAPCIGTVKTQKVAKLAVRIMNEKVFDSAEEENSYIASSLKNVAKDAKKVLFVSTSDITISDRLTAICKGLGLEACFISNVRTNKDIFEVSPTCDTIIAVEKAGVSTRKNSCEMVSTIDRCDKTVNGVLFLL